MPLFIFFALYVTVLRNKLSEQYCLDGVFIHVNIICIISFTGWFSFLLLCFVVYVYFLRNLCWIYFVPLLELAMVPLNTQINEHLIELCQIMSPVHSIYHLDIVCVTAYRAALRIWEIHLFAILTKLSHKNNAIYCNFPPLTFLYASFESYRKRMRAPLHDTSITWERERICTEEKEIVLYILQL